MNEYPGQARARFLALVDLKAKAKTPPPIAAIFDGGLEKEELTRTKHQLAATLDILDRYAGKIARQRATIRRAYKLLRKSGFTLKAI